MSACNFEYLLQFVNDELDADRQLDLYEHLNQCPICRDAVCQISRDLKRSLFIYCASRVKRFSPRRRAGTAGTGDAHPGINRPVRRAAGGSGGRA